MFKFKKIDNLTDGLITLKLAKKKQEDEAKGYLPACVFHIMLYKKKEPVGLIDLRIGSNQNTFYGGNVGYRINEEHRGHGYAAKACLLIKKAALIYGMDKLTITCNPDNFPSRRTCQNIGAKLIEIVELPPENEMYQRGERQKCRYEWDLKV